MRIVKEVGSLGESKMNAGPTEDGYVAIPIEHGGVRLIGLLTVQEAEAFGCGIIGAATMIKATAAHRRNVVLNAKGEAPALEKLEG